MLTYTITTDTESRLNKGSYPVCVLRLFTEVFQFSLHIPSDSFVDSSIREISYFCREIRALRGGDGGGKGLFGKKPEIRYKDRGYPSCSILLYDFEKEPDWVTIRNTYVSEEEVAGSMLGVKVREIDELLGALDAFVAHVNEGIRTHSTLFNPIG